MLRVNTGLLTASSSRSLYSPHSHPCLWLHVIRAFLVCSFTQNGSSKWICAQLRFFCAAQLFTWRTDAVRRGPMGQLVIPIYFVFNTYITMFCQVFEPRLGKGENGCVLPLYPRFLQVSRTLVPPEYKVLLFPKVPRFCTLASDLTIIPTRPV